MESNPLRHTWDAIRDLPLTIEAIPTGTRGVHESIFRSYQILGEVKEMLDRGDSVETVREFIRWAEM